MKNNIISARLDAAYQMMVADLKFPDETDSMFIRRAIDALAMTDDNLAKILGVGEELLSEADNAFLDQYEAAGHKRVSTLIFEAPIEEDDL